MAFASRRPQLRPCGANLPRSRRPRRAVARSCAEGGGEGGRARVAAFVSGGGSNLRAIAGFEGFTAAGELALVVASKGDCRGAEWARERGVDVVVWPREDGSDAGGEALLEEMQSRAVGVVVLAGYLKLVPECVVRAYDRRMLNVHPALLPAFGGKGMYGGRVHSAVVASGARFSGPTVHFVSAEYDRGAILAQRAVPVLPGDTPDKLAARVLRQEHWLFPRAVAALCAGRVEWRDDSRPIVAELEEAKGEGDAL